MVCSGLLAQSQTVKPAEGAAAPSEKKTPLFGISFSGYVNTDIFFDTRQTVMAREGQWLFYPENIRPDANGNDINAKATYNILSIQTRITGNITGPDVFKAKSSGLIEGEFYGNVNPNINTFRLRHAWIKLTWPKTELMFGQGWHPMYVPACTPEPVSLNGGSPFIVFTRNPQVRITKQVGHFKLIAAALSQVDVTSNGPDGPSPKYLRNSVLPELAFQVQYAVTWPEKQTEFMIGASMDYLLLTPRLSTEIVDKPAFDSIENGKVKHYNAVVRNYVTDNKAPSVSGNFFAKLKLPKVTLKIGGVYGGNCYAYNMIGGYGVTGTPDPLTGAVDYTTVTTASAWTDIKTNGTRWATGLFAGYSKNLGAAEPLTGAVYSRGDNIDYLYRVAPRVTLTVNKLKFAFEPDYTVAAYGTRTGKGLVSAPKEVGNLRLLFGVYYYF